MNMKYAITVIAALIATPANASDSLCQSVYAAAEKVMEARQRGMPITEMIEILFSKGPSKYSEVDRKMKDFVFDAYDHPRYNTREVQQRETRNFANDKATECYREARGK
jgi:hypothetical protein